MTDTNDNVTGDLFADEAAAQPEVPAPAAPAKRKPTPRARYTDSFMLKVQANRAPDAPCVLLAHALKGCGVAHKAIDQLYGIPDDTTQTFMLNNAPQVDQATGEVLFDSKRALEVFDRLYALTTSEAFTSTGLNITGVLAAMQSYATQVWDEPEADAA